MTENTAPFWRRLTASHYLLLSGVLFTISHTTVKYLQSIPAFEIAFFRGLISLALSFFALRAAGVAPWGKNRPMLVLRGLFGTAAFFLYFHTLQVMPLASAVTIQYLSPIFTVTIASLVLRERPSWLQWVFILASFAGVLLVEGFDGRVTAFDAGLGVLAAVFSACAYNLVRHLRHEDHALVVVFYFSLVTTVVMGPVAAYRWQSPTWTEWALLVLIGVLTQGAQYCMTLAYQGDKAANISNLNYLSVIYAIAIGSLFFDEPVAPVALAGMGLIILSAVLSARLKSRQPAAAP